MFLSASFARIDTTSVTRSDDKFELALSFVSIDTASVTRLDVNDKSIYYLVTLDGKVNMTVLYT